MFFEDRENVYILLELCTNHVRDGRHAAPESGKPAKRVCVLRVTAASHTYATPCLLVYPPPSARLLLVLRQWSSEGFWRYNRASSAWR